MVLPECGIPRLCVDLVASVHNMNYDTVKNDGMSDDDDEKQEHEKEHEHKQEQEKEQYENNYSYYTTRNSLLRYLDGRYELHTIGVDDDNSTLLKKYTTRKDYALLQSELETIQDEFACISMDVYQKYRSLMNPSERLNKVLQISRQESIYWQLFHMIDLSLIKSYIELDGMPGSGSMAIMKLTSNKKLFGRCMSLTKDIELDWDRTLLDKLSLVKKHDVRVIDASSILIDDMIVSHVEYVRKYKKRKKPWSNGVDLVICHSYCEFQIDSKKDKELIVMLKLQEEFLCSLLLLCRGGTLIFRLYDHVQKGTLRILGAINALFQNVQIIKPLSSRPYNNEKFIIARGFLLSETSLNVKMVSKIFCQYDNIYDTRTLFALRSWLISYVVPIDIRNWLNAWQVMSWKGQLKASKDLLECIDKNDDYKECIDQQTFAEQWITTISNSNSN